MKLIARNPIKYNTWLRLLEPFVLILQGVISLLLLPTPWSSFLHTYYLKFLIKTIQNRETKQYSKTQEAKEAPEPSLIISAEALREKARQRQEEHDERMRKFDETIRVDIVKGLNEDLNMNTSMICKAHVIDYRLTRAEIDYLQRRGFKVERVWADRRGIMRISW